MEDQFLLFENYIAGNLSPKEIEDFNLKLQKDFSFNEEFNNYKETYSFLKNKFENETEQKVFEQNLDKISEEHFKQNARSKNKLWYLGVAASIALLIGLFLANPSKPTYEEFRIYPEVDFTERSTQTSTFKDLENTFKNKDFAKANTILTALIKSNINNTEFKLYNGFTLVELNRFKEADFILNEISKGSSSYKTQAIWYLALSKLKQKEYSNCKNLLKTIPKEAIYYKKAQQLINELP